MNSAITTPEAFVLFPLGAKRFALSAEHVTELARQDRCQQFPHTTPLISGVVLRRNQIVPVVDIAPVLLGTNAPERKFFLVIQRNRRGKIRQMAIPVSGECELVEAKTSAGNGELQPFVSGLLSLKDEIVEIVDIDSLVAAEVRP